MSLDERLKALRKIAQNICEELVRDRRDIIAVLVVGSVARGNVHEESDIDMCVLTKEGDKPKREFMSKSGFKADIVYVPLKLWMERLWRDIGSMWEINVSNILDSIVLYDPTGLVKRIKKEFSKYPEEKRKQNILYHFHMMGWYQNSAKYHYLKGNYDIESIFSKLFAIEALKILFPLNGVYLKGDKYLFEQVKNLKAPSGYLKKCFDLLWFRTKGINHEEATWIMNTISEIMDIAKEEVMRFGLKIPDIVQ